MCLPVHTLQRGCGLLVVGGGAPAFPRKGVLDGFLFTAHAGLEVRLPRGKVFGGVGPVGPRGGKGCNAGLQIVTAAEKVRKKTASLGVEILLAFLVSCFPGSLKKTSVVQEVWQRVFVAGPGKGLTLGKRKLGRREKTKDNVVVG